MLQGWALELSEHRYMLWYRSGVLNGAADALSRLTHLLAAVIALPYSEARRLDSSSAGHDPGYDALAAACVEPHFVDEHVAVVAANLMAARFSNAAAPISGSAHSRACRRVFSCRAHNTCVRTPLLL